MSEIIGDKHTSNVNECPKCGSWEITTVNSRNWGYRTRRKKCKDCGYMFTTIEITADEYMELKRIYDSLSKALLNLENIREVIKNGL